MKKCLFSVMAVVSLAIAGHTQGPASPKRETATELGLELRHEKLSAGQAEIEIWKTARAYYPDSRLREDSFASVAERAFQGTGSK